MASTEAATAVPCAVQAYGKAVLHCVKYPTQAVCGLLVGKRLPSAASAAASAASIASAASATASSLFVADAVPLLHTLPRGCGALSSSSSGGGPVLAHPAFEAALAQVAAVARGAGSAVLGLYVAHERLDDNDVAPNTRRLVQVVFERLFGSASSSASSSSGGGSSGGGGGPLLLWQVRNPLLRPDQPRVCVRQVLFTYNAATGAMTESELPNNNGNNNNSSNSGGNLRFTSWNGETCAPDAGGIATEAALAAVAHAVGERFAYARLADFDDHLEDVQADYIRNPLVIFELPRSPQQQPPPPLAAAAGSGATTTAAAGRR